MKGLGRGGKEGASEALAESTKSPMKSHASLRGMGVSGFVMRPHQRWGAASRVADKSSCQKFSDKGRYVKPLPQATCVKLG
jgi:hypothetical protein